MKTLVVIPAYNEGNAISGVLKDLKSHGYKNLVVVDDGSKDKTGEIARKSGAVVLSHIINRGLGAALGTGFAYAKEHNFKSLVTFDADGQHEAKDVKDLLKEIENESADVVVGKRPINSKNTPLSRKLANLLANIVTYTFFGVWTNDSQSGLRAFSKQALEKIQIKTDRMEVSSEFFKEIHQHNLKYKEIDIRAIYTDYSLTNSKQGSVGRSSFSIGYKMLLRVFR